MREVKFYGLPRGIQDRFIACAKGAGEPRALLQARAPRALRMLAWPAAGAAFLLILAAVFALGFGRLHSPFARQSPLFVGFYAVLVAGAVLAAVQGRERGRQRSALPFPARTYLFPIGVIEASSPIVRTHHLGPGTRWEYAHGVFRIVFAEGAESHAFTFPLRDAARAGYVERGLLAARERMALADSTSDRRLLGALDPLIDIGAVNPFAPTTGHAELAPRGLATRAVLVPIAALALGVALWFVRNAASDAVMLSDANRQSTAQAYGAYLAAGGKSEAVRRVLLPRAELAEAVRHGGVDAIERFAAHHPGAAIQPEVDAALRDAMLRDLEAAKAPGTVAQLREFARAHPTPAVEEELRSAIHALYQKAFATYRNEAPKDPQVLALVERLFAVLERQGPTVELRFHRRASRTMAAADRSVKKSPFFMGTPSLPSQYFDERHARARERLVGATLKQRFLASFSPDILNLELAAPVLDSEPAGAPVRVPTIVIDHAAEVSGGSYLSTNPRGVFVGLGLLFDVAFHIPDDPKPHAFRLSAWRPPDIHTRRRDDGFESAVYEAMATTGYVQFAERYLATFFSRERARAQN
jgi:hypothetical protein